MDRCGESRGWKGLGPGSGFLLLTLLAGCGAPPPPQAPPPTPVRASLPLHRQVVAWDEYPGRIEAVESVDVRARVDGYLKKVHFKAGDLVRQGDLLFEIDPRPFQAQLDYAQAELERARARLAIARGNLERAEHLVEATAFSREEYETRKAQFTEALATVRSAEANLEAARLNLEFTRVRAPITGRIGRELITPGNLVKGGGADATLLTFLVSTDPVYVYVDVDERSALNYQRAVRSARFPDRPDLPLGVIPAELGLVDEPGFPHRGHIDYEAPRLDRDTGTLTLRAVFANPDGFLIPGLFARLRLPADAPFQGVLIPDRAVVTDLAQKFVWVVKAEDQIERRSVTLGPLIDGLRVIRQGLQPEDWVIVEGVQKVRPGLPLQVERVPLEAP